MRVVVAVTDYGVALDAVGALGEHIGGRRPLGNGVGRLGLTGCRAGCLHVEDAPVALGECGEVSGDRWERHGVG